MRCMRKASSRRTANEFEMEGEMTMRLNMRSCATRIVRVVALATAFVALALDPSGLLYAQIGDRAVKFILPVATASGVDTITRAASPALAKALGHPVIVDNQPGAGGIV